MMRRCRILDTEDNLKTVWSCVGERALALGGIIAVTVIF